MKSNIQFKAGCSEFQLVEFWKPAGMWIIEPCMKQCWGRQEERWKDFSVLCCERCGLESSLGCRYACSHCKHHIVTIALIFYVIVAQDRIEMHGLLAIA